ncbi:MAG TPA: sulfate ABC transporter substrate-binding protein, partial [Thermomicrobiales bacterium]|nr:sulfate ABC transporter substrate-binding protein [Thermomicrobiales bacterium]
PLSPARRMVLVILSLALAGFVAACGGPSGQEGGGEALTLAAYSTPQEAYKEEVIPAFQKTPQGKGLTFDQSYGASGEQSRAVEGGLPADVVALSLEPDVTKLEEPGLVDPSWKKDKYKGFVTNSVVVFAVRPGNPKKIKTWEDLTKPGVEVITPNPFTSGGAKWNIMAAYGAQSDQGRNEQAGVDYLKRLFANVPVQDKSARESLQTFTAGKGDVLLAYENEAITARDKGEKIDYVVPDDTILIENPIAVTKESQQPDKAKAFVDFARSEEAQKIFAKRGYRPVLESANDPQRFPEPAGLFKIDKFGGWSAVNDKFFDPEKSIFAEIQRANGVSTESG